MGRMVIQRMTTTTSSMSAPERSIPWNLSAPRVAIGAEGTYLITGGTGAVGRAVAVALHERGARRLTLEVAAEPEVQPVPSVIGLTEAEARQSSLAHVVTKALGGRGPSEPTIQPDVLAPS